MFSQIASVVVYGGGEFWLPKSNVFQVAGGGAGKTDTASPQTYWPGMQWGPTTVGSEALSLT